MTIRTIEKYVPVHRNGIVKMRPVFILKNSNHGASK